MRGGKAACSTSLLLLANDDSYSAHRDSSRTTLIHVAYSYQAHRQSRLTIEQQSHPAMFSLCGMLASSAAATIPSANPPWAPVYDMQMSTLTMQCNGSGWSSPERGGQFGIVSYDWSNAKEQWAAAKPVNKLLGSLLPSHLHGVRS